MDDATPPDNDLQAELLNDASGTKRANLLARLRSLHDHCQAAKRQPVQREMFARLQAANVAVNAAIRIVETLPASRANGN